MSNFPEKKIFEKADNWMKNNKKVSLATVVQQLSKRGVHHH